MRTSLCGKDVRPAGRWERGRPAARASLAVQRAAGTPALPGQSPNNFFICSRAAASRWLVSDFGAQTRRANSKNSQKLPVCFSSTGSARRSRHCWATRGSWCAQFRQTRRSARHFMQVSPRPGWPSSVHGSPQLWQWRFTFTIYDLRFTICAGSIGGNHTS